jgi:hypothetical protein
MGAAMRGHNDPLAGKTTRQIYQMCIWASDEPSSTKLFLLCVSRFFDAEGRSSSMSYTQVASDSSLSERTAKRIAGDVAGRWLRVEIGKGYRTASGPQNLYHALIPDDVLARVRAALSATRAAAQEVTQEHPLVAKGCSGDTPKGCHGDTPLAARGVMGDSKGCHGVTLTRDNLDSKKDNKQRISNPSAVAAALDLDELQEKLLGACNGALANPVNSMGLLNLAIPQMWMAEGSDLELDILPTLRAMGQRYHGKRIASWAYFTPAVADTTARRKAGMPAGHVGKPVKSFKFRRYGV